MIEAIVEITLVGTGTFVRWFIFNRGEKLKSNQDNGDFFWTDLTIGFLVWTSVGSGVYYFMK